jgi:rhodanese-related sulfurtransferase
MTGAMIQVKSLKSRRLAVVLISGLVLVWSAGPVSARFNASADAIALVRACAKSQARLDHFSARLTTISENQSFNGSLTREETQALIRRDGDCLDVGARNIPSSPKPNVLNQARRTRIVLTKDICISSWCPVSKPDPPGTGIASKDLAIMFSARGLNRAHGGPLDGYFPPSGNHRIASIMAESDNPRLLKEEKINGVQCAHIEAVTPHGTFTMWLDRSKGCLPSKVSYMVGPDDFHEYWDPVLFSRKLMPGPDGNQHSGTEENGVLEDIVYERVADAYVPVAGKFTRVDVYGEFKQWSMYTYKRTEIQLSPRFEGTDAFVSDLRDGARITNTADSRSGLNYEWRGGKVVIAGTDNGGDAPTYYAEHGSTSLKHAVMAICGVLLFAAGTFMTARIRPQQDRMRSKAPAVSASLAIILTLTVGSTIANAESPKNDTSRHREANFEPYCGVQSLYRAMLALGRDITFDHLLHSDYIGSKQGSSIANLQQAAEDNGVHLQSMSRMTCPMLREMSWPVILHVKPTPASDEYKHWVLFMGSSDGIVSIFDGARPGAEMTEEELTALWDGTGLIVSTEPVNNLGLWWTMSGPYLFYGGLCASSIAGVSLISRRFEWPLKDARFAAFRNALAQAVCLVVVAVVLCIGYRLANGTGYLSNERAVAAIQDSHLGTFLPKIKAKEVANLIDMPGVTIVDARKSNDYEFGHLPGAVSIPVDGDDAQCRSALIDKPEDSTIVVYSQTRYCSYGYIVAKRLKALGYHNIVVFRDGYAEWDKQQFATGGSS